MELSKKQTRKQIGHVELVETSHIYSFRFFDKLRMTVPLSFWTTP